MKKRILSVLLALVFTLSLSVSAWALDETPGMKQVADAFGSVQNTVTKATAKSNTEAKGMPTKSALCRGTSIPGRSCNGTAT